MDQASTAPASSEPGPKAGGLALRARSVSRRLAGDILDSCEAGARSAEEAARVARDIDQGVSRLDAAVHETTAAMGEIRAESDATVLQAIDALTGVRDRVTEGADEIQRLSESVVGLTTFVRSIRLIVDQTKLLSLNARIEASHAGEAGRGFAVVAEEVRRLADTAATEASMVTATITRLQHEAQQTRATVAAVTRDVDALAASLNGLRNSSETHWQSALEHVAAIRAQKRDVEVANRQVQTAALRASDDIAATVAATARLIELDGSEAEWADEDEQIPTLDQIRASGVLRVGLWHGIRGLNFKHPVTGEIVGLEVELLNELARSLGIRVEMIDAAWVDLPKKLRRRDFDLLFCALIPSPDYRGLRYSKPYLDMGLIVMRRAGDERISDVDALNGKTVAIVADPAARQALKDCGIEPGAIREVYDDDAYDPVADGVYDAFVLDLPLVYWCATDPDSPWCGRIEIVGDPLTKWIYCAAVRDEPASSTLLDAVDDAIVRLRQSTRYRDIVERWQGNVYEWHKRAEDFLEHTDAADPG